MGDPTFTMAGDFPALDHEQWRKMAEASLKGAPLEKLVRRIGELSIQPLYTRSARTTADGESAPDATGWPGTAPFVRGTRAARDVWDVRQVYFDPMLSIAQRAMLTDLERGVTSVELRLDRASREGRALSADTAAGDGLPIARLDDLQAVLAGVHDDLAPVSLSAGASSGAAAALLLAMAEQRGRDPGSYRAQLNLDPVSAWAAGESGPLSVEQGLEVLGDAGVHGRRWPLVKTARVDGSVYHDAGASEVDELAAVLATGVAYLRVMTGAGLSVHEAGADIVLRIAVDADLFMGIAKLRALRQTWGRVLESAGADQALASVRIEATTSRPMMTRRDPWVNMLRNTVACFSSAVGGADTIHVRPFDEAVGLPDELSRRVARNTQVVLQEESHLDQVIDPAGGSWFVEDLTRQLAKAAWTQFQAIEKEGGIVAALRSGRLCDRIDAYWRDRETALARRKEPITGVSEFPNLGEAEVPVRVRDLSEALRSRPEPSATFSAGEPWAPAPPGQSTARAVRAAASGATIQQIIAQWRPALTAEASTAEPTRPLALRSRAAGFEALRDASDRYRERHGHRPKIILAKLGPISEHTARVTYARNFFEAGGIEAVDPAPVADAEEATAVAEAHPDARFIVVCGSDDRYAAEVATIVPALKAAAPRRVYLAGRPGAHEQAYTSAGVDDFIYLGVNVLEALQRAHAHLETDSPTGSA